MSRIIHSYILKEFLIWMIIAIGIITATGFAQVYLIDPNKTMISTTTTGRGYTWIYVDTIKEYTDFQGIFHSYEEHSFVRIDQIMGLRGPFYSNSTGELRNKVYLILEDSRYPEIYLPDISTNGDDRNLDWAIAVQTVAELNPGGIVDLANYLPPP